MQNNQVAFDATIDFAGPLTIAAAAQNSTTNGRVVVIGDSSFASDIYFDQYGNGDLFINSVDWAAGQGNMINLTSSQPISRQMRLPSSFTILLLAFVFVILIPGLIIAGWCGILAGAAFTRIIPWSNVPPGYCLQYWLLAVGAYFLIKEPAFKE